MAILKPSVRGANCLEKAGISHLDGLVGWTLGALSKIRNMGRKTLQELVDSLQSVVEGAREGNEGGSNDLPPVEPTPGSPLTLLDEWLTFSGGLECPRELLLDRLPLDDDLLAALRILDTTTVPELLARSLAEVRDLLGDDSTEELLNGLLSLAVASRGSRSLCSGTSVPVADELREMLAERWADAPVQSLELSPATTAVLQNARLATLRE
ncbi:MAG TPA: DNA-directed RNA polymerase subunit alpha C-terminal domain-containing protein, partial [Armatimonadota bacterium]|nr:DNA-directed RNA polymerase subunit alpha C-terminal domain-containing protein [Armatimonadota bacterium]